MSTESKKVTKPQAYFLLIFGIAFVIGGFAITEDADAVILFVAGAVLSTFAVIWGVKYNDIQHTISPSLFYFLAGLIYAATGFNMTKVTDEQIKEEEAALN